MAEPLEAYPQISHNKSRYVRSLEENVQRLENEISAGAYFYLHIAAPCASWSTLQKLNGGTRTLACPSGDGSSAKERLENEQAKIAARLCLLQHSVGNYFSIETPARSMIWNFPDILELSPIANKVLFDQCCFGLKPPPNDHDNDSVRIRKPTCLCINMDTLVT